MRHLGPPRRMIPVALALLSITLIGLAVSGFAPASGASIAPDEAPPSLVATLQTENDLPTVMLRPRDSRVLRDNFIGTDIGSFSENSEVAYPIGFKWVRTGFTQHPLNWQYAETKTGDHVVPKVVDDLLTQYANNGIRIVLNLGVGDSPPIAERPTFVIPQALDRYLSYARFMVRHFKGRIAYYELWNEPEGELSVEAYSDLIKQVVPVIRSEDPRAKIVIGVTSGDWVTGFPGYGESLRFALHTDYLTDLLQSGVAPLVDVISWHPFYGIRPDDPYYQNYALMVRQIRELAAAEGFHGDFLVEEAWWRTPSTAELDVRMQMVTEIVAAKYYLRMIAMHRGLGFIVTVALPAAYPELPKVKAIHNLCDFMAGAGPLDVPAEITSAATNVKSYGLVLPGGDKAVALWTDGIGIDIDPGLPSTGTLPGFAGQTAIAVDLLNGLEQELVASDDGAALVIEDLLIKDYPIIIRLSDTPQFSDVPLTHPYYHRIMDLASLGIVSGFGSGQFGPDNAVTRQQFAKMIVLTKGYPVSEQDECLFKDVATDMGALDPLYPDHYVAVCAAHGITVGKEPGKFAPYDNITRAQLITMVARAADLLEPPAGYAPVFGDFSSTHYPWARKAACAGLLEGLEGMGSDYGFFAPATRGEVCVLLDNLLSRTEE